MEDPRHLKRGNLLWESSRMFLPEHREQLLEHRRRLRAFIPPEPDEDRIRLMNGVLAAAMATGRRVAVTVAGECAPEVRVGRVDKADPVLGRLRLNTDDGRMWIPFGRLLHAEWAEPGPAGDAADAAGDFADGAGDAAGGDDEFDDSDAGFADGGHGHSNGLGGGFSGVASRKEGNGRPD